MLQMKHKKEKEEENHTKKLAYRFSNNNNPRSKVMVKKVYPIFRDDTEYRPKHHENRQDHPEFRIDLKIMINGIPLSGRWAKLQ